VVQLVHARRREGSRPGQRKDSFKIGLAIEVSVTFQVYGLLGRWLLIDWETHPPVALYLDLVRGAVCEVPCQQVSRVIPAR
jgi:hypothetical protein